MPLRSRKFLALLGTLIILALTPFVLAGTWSFQTAWQSHWHPVMHSTQGLLNHTRFLISILALEFVRRAFELPLHGPRIPPGMTRLGRRLFPVVALLFWLEIVNVVTGNPIGLDAPTLYRLVLLTELAFVLSFSCKWLEDKPDAGRMIGDVLFLSAVPAWVLLAIDEVAKRNLGFYLRTTVRGVVEVLSWIDSSALRYFPKSQTVSFGGGNLRLLADCGGTESATLGLLIILAFLVLFRKNLRWPRALMILPVGLVLLWCGNVARLVALFLYGRYSGWQNSVETFHSNIGWLFFNFVIVTYLVAVAQSGWFTMDKNVPATGGDRWWLQPTARYVLPLVILSSIGLITGAINTSIIDPLYAVKVLMAGACVLVLWRPSLTHLEEKSSDPRWLLSVGVGIIMFGVWLFAEILRVRLGGVSFAALAEPPPLLSLWIWAMGSSTVIPVVEELAFRGYLMRRIALGLEFEKGRYQTVGWLGIGLSSIAFAAGHTQFFGALLAGVAFAQLCRKTNRVVSAIIAHATTNLLWAIYVISTGSWFYF